MVDCRCNAALVGVVSLAPIAFWVFFATQYIAEGRHPDEHVPEDKEHDLDSPSLMSVYSSIVYAIPYVMSFVWGASFVLRWVICGWWYDVDSHSYV